MTVAPVFFCCVGGQNESRLCRWLGECYIGGEKLVKVSTRGGFIFEVHCAYSKISLIWAMSTAEEVELIFGRICCIYY